MHLSPREQEKLLIVVAGDVARRVRRGDDAAREAAIADVRAGDGTACGAAPCE